MSDIAQELFTYENLVHALAGMTGGVTAITTFYPLNVIRTKLQVDESLKSKNAFVLMKQIAEEEGIQTLYQGWWSSVVSLGCSNFVYFYSYNALKAIYFKFVLESTPKLTMIDPLTNLAIGATAGIINVLATTPLWVAGTRLMMQSKKQTTETPYTGVIDTLTRIVNEEGIGALWNGVGPGLMLVSNPTIQFATYERLRGPMAKMAEKRGSPITSVEFFVMGAIAKAVATLCTYPIQIAQSRLRADKGAEKAKYKGTVDCLKKIYAIGGVLAWFKGMEAKLYQTVLTAAFQFLTYEQVQKLVFSLLLGNKAKVASA